ncbi:MAG: SUMF1/EgtB/PvdO family nonheme iron enzyme [Armatimonadetes bacterium]|nr:SUMF1/EgtB/PvdO family nonheme iron enzyme [Armatimonadota bacterium]
MRRTWLLLTLLALPAVAGEFTVAAPDFDTANIRVSQTGGEYADGPACIWNAGTMPNRAEYELDFPLTTEYTLSALYAAADPRPVVISLDGKAQLTGFSGKTGSWQTKSARWEVQGKLRIERGRHVLALECGGPFPHICALRFETAEDFPAGWKQARPTPEERAERAQRKIILAALREVDPEAVRLAIDDLAATFAGRYDAARYRQALANLGAERERLLAAGAQADFGAARRLLDSVRSALLANPLLDGGRLLVVRRNLGGAARAATGADAGFVPANYLNQTAMPRHGFDNEIALLSDLRGTPRAERLHRPSGDTILRDVRLDYSGQKMLFSGIDARGRWAVFEVTADGATWRQLTPTDYPDLDFFDGCYLPDGRLIVCATGSYQGLPCLDGNGQIASLYLCDPAQGSLRQLTFDQDSDNDPIVLNDGRVLYQRWEYSDIPHYFSRRRMAMNPDGTSQMAIHGSNSWYPTAFRFARPVPDHPTRLVGIISGHHDFGDCGRMAVIDPGLAGGYPFRFRPASKEWGIEGQPIAVTPDILPADRTGFLQLVPGRGKTVAGTVCDAIIGHLYRPEYPALTTHPFPLSSKYHLVSRKPTPDSLWGIYLVDVFDNSTLIAEVEGAALFEPQLLSARSRPPVIPDRITPNKRSAEVRIADIYAGPGLAGVPRGTVKQVRVFAYHFGYNARAGFPLIGTQAGWDVKRILGTASVEADGSASFEIPANTPVSLQPVDAEGRAVQLMRSWLVGMPGEHVSCVGCHESRGEAIPQRLTLASGRPAQPLAPWYGPARPFAFAPEVYPVLERYCKGCHDGPAQVGPRSKPSFATPDTAYDTLHPYVHRPGVESDMALLTPMEYHATTSPVVQMLTKGHHGVTLAGMDRESRERLYTWIDLNVPRTGRWSPPAFQQADQRQRRRELAVTFASNDCDPEAEYQAVEAAFTQRAPVRFQPPPKEDLVTDDGQQAADFPLAAAEATRQQQAHLGGARRVVSLGDGVTLTLAWIPAGEFVMGSLDGAPDERPRRVVKVTEPFWMGTTEVTNSQYARFDPEHDTRYVDMHSLDRVVPGYIANHPNQPVARVSCQEAERFCRWLSEKVGLHVSLPSEPQWEYAARAGSATRFWWGGLEADWGRCANLADRSLRWFAMGYDGPSALQRRNPYPPEMNFPLHDERYNDPWHVVDYVAQTEPSPWGLHDVVGNVSEWTAEGVARGGSWADRPVDAGASVRRTYAPWQKVYDVGFRVLAQ